MVDPSRICRLYRDLLKESAKFKSYYYRNYFTKKTKVEFRRHLNADSETSTSLYEKGEDMLAMLKRQTLISNLYYDSRLVIERADGDN